MNYNTLNMETPNPQTPKRPRTDENDSDLTFDKAKEIWPHFLVVEGPDAEKPLSKISVFLLSKWYKGLASEPKPNDIKRLRSGQVLLEVHKSVHATNMKAT